MKAYFNRVSRVVREAQCAAIGALLYINRRVFINDSPLLIRDITLYRHGRNIGEIRSANTPGGRKVVVFATLVTESAGN